MSISTELLLVDPPYKISHRYQACPTGLEKFFIWICVKSLIYVALIYKTILNPLL